METQVGFTTAQGQSFTPGIQGFSNAAAPVAQDPMAVSPNAIRWLFNPFAFVNISNRPISGHHFLKAGVFIPITNQTDRQSVSGIATSPGKAFDWQNGNQPQANGTAEPGAPKGSYRAVVRTAFAIASEIEDAYSDRGVRILETLTGFDDIEAIRTLHAELLAGGLEYNPDPYQPDFPIPNLLKLENYLLKTAAGKVQGLNLTIDPIALINNLLVSVRQAKTTCLETTRDAKRVVANKTAGYQHVFDAYASRCFIALGEAVPSDLGEMYGKTAETMPIGDSAELSRLRAENERLREEAHLREIDALKAENAALRAEPVIEEVVKCDFVKADGTICKGFPVSGETRCRHHIEKAEEIVVESDGSKGNAAI